MSKLRFSADVSRIYNNIDDGDVQDKTSDSDHNNDCNHNETHGHYPNVSDKGQSYDVSREMNERHRT